MTYSFECFYFSFLGCRGVRGVAIAYLVLLLIFAELLNKLKYLKIFSELSLTDFEPWGGACSRFN